MTEIVAVDLGGTHARFVIADVTQDRDAAFGDPVIYKTHDHTSFEAAWTAFAQSHGRDLPRAAAIAIAGPVHGPILQPTNNPWVIRRQGLTERLGVDRLTLINDFGAIGHAVAQLPESNLRHLCGPDVGLPPEGVITVVGPGTGLGVAYVLRRAGQYFVGETEGGHIDFAPRDGLEDSILSHLRQRYMRVSTERIASGPGLANIYEALARIEGRTSPAPDDLLLWNAALDGSDPLAVTALERFCLSFGSIAGDLALTHGASAVVIAGGIGLRLVDRLGQSGFCERFTAKGRFERLMAAIPVKVITYPEPGLFGAAAAFVAEHGAQRRS
jgi:glucokinase